ncbi:MAG: dTDP-4-dehydrorhamnose reductase [Candidatus Xenobia bacterium]
MTVVVLGGSGQVGGAISARLPDAVAVARPQVDYTDLPGVVSLLDRHRPSVVINGAAYTQVDQAESDCDTAQKVNAELPAALARWCAAHHAWLVHFSTDYVYPGTGDQPWSENAPVGPINVYGKTKADGEQGILQSGCRSLILRTSWVYDATGKNFLRTMLRLFAEKETMGVVDDQFGAPTFAGDLADAVVSVLSREPTGIYNACNAGETTWYGFARAILEEARERGLPVVTRTLNRLSTSDWKSPAPRPANSRLDCTRLQTELGVQLRPWREALRACMDQVTRRIIVA